MIPGKLKIEVTKEPIYHVGKNGEHLTKDPIYHVGKNGEHFYGENFIYEYPSKRHTKSNEHMDILHVFSKSNQHMGILHAFSKSNQHTGILHAFSNCVRETFNHGLSPYEVDWGDPKGEPTKCSSTHQVGTCSWRLTGEGTSSIITPQADPCSWKLTGETNSYSTLWLTGELMKLTKWTQHL